MKKYRDHTFIFVNIIAPLLIGGFIYLLFRDGKLLMFRWLSFLEMDSLLTLIRSELLELRPVFPQWLLYSLPDALWVYSFATFVYFIWESNSLLRFLFSGILIAFSLLAESLQATHILRGTFDWTDFNLILFFGFFSVINCYFYFSKRSIECVKTI